MYFKVFGSYLKIKRLPGQKTRKYFLTNISITFRNQRQKHWTSPWLYFAWWLVLVMNMCSHWPFCFCGIVVSLTGSHSPKGWDTWGVEGVACCGDTTADVDVLPTTFVLVSVYLVVSNLLFYNRSKVTTSLIFDFSLHWFHAKLYWNSYGNYRCYVLDVLR